MLMCGWILSKNHYPGRMLMRTFIIVCLSCASACGADLPKLLDNAVAETLQEFADNKLQSNQLAVTAIKLADDGQPLTASFRGDAPIYPASVVKLFYLVAAHQWMEDGKIKDTEELRRAMRDMIVESYNEA